MVDLKKPTDISSVSLNTCVDKGSWVFDARAIEVAVSDDGKTFRTVADVDLPALAEDTPDKVYTHSVDFKPTKARYVRLIAKTERALPQWHAGKGKPGFLFVDEISVK